MKRKRAAVIIQCESGIILIYRKKIVDDKLKEYYVIPGGGVDEGETIENAAIREIKEEIGIDIELGEMIFFFEKEEAEEYFFQGKYMAGRIGTGTGEEFSNNSEEYRKKYGTYHIKIINKEEIKNINLLPPQIKEYIENNME
ncbi:MAG: NUDIX domain-containing protein [Clostridia bacterium]|nr:NUDIX domain-containing protein [Clostridia bacterium]MDD4375705.1 NUDIX domain-containing protein [Clostridia bacterium]